MKKVTSAAVIIYNPVTQEILAEHPTGRKWYKTGTKEPETGVFSLPKGMIDEGEQPVETAIREIKEECDIDLDKKRLHYLGHYEYIKYKDLELFYYPVKSGEIDIKECKCTSFFDGPGGKKLPEVNGFTWLHRESDLHFFFASQQTVIKKTITEYPEFFR
jgi:predicted NUDIX family NTP pyrophosphohydrolase